MATKQFYFICLIGITLFTGLILLFIKSRLKNKSDRKSSFFIALAMFSWATIAFYKLFDPPIPALLLSDIDRIFSVFTNIFFVAALPFFSNVFLKFRSYVPIFRRTESWVSNVFIFFTFLAALFAVIERNVESTQGKNLIVAIDSLFSTITIGLISYAVYKSMSHLIKERSTKIFIGFFMIFFPSSQFLIPITAIFPEQLNYLYFPFLLVLLLGLVFFSFITVTYYSIISEKSFEVENKVQEDSKRQQALFIKQLKIGYNETNKLYFIEIEFSIDHKTVVERVENRKILLPFSNWMLFSIAKKLDVKLLNHDIALTKFRMVEYWNKESETKLTQEFLFINDFGSFEFNMDNTIISFENLDFLESKLIITEVIQKHIDNFSSLQSNQENQKVEVADIFSFLRK